MIIPPLSPPKEFSPEDESQAVAVIGMGALFPGRPGLSGFWSLVKTGQVAISPIPADRFRAEDYYHPDPKARDRIYSDKGAFVEAVPFQPLKYGITPKDIESIDSTQLLGLMVADAALIDAGYPAESFDHSRTAVILGVTGPLKMVVTLGTRMAHPQLRKALADSGVDEDTAKDVMERFLNQFAPWKEASFPGLLGNVAAGRIASRLNLGGANLAVDAACASSLAAVSQAVLELRSGRADMVVTGGLDTFNDPFMYACFSKTPALSRKGEVKAFDRDGDGTMLGEGLGVIILKRLSEARAQGDRVYAILRSVGGASDGKGTAIFAPSPSGQRRAMERAYAEAGWSPSSVELVEAHGTGTAVGDTAELSALSDFYKESGEEGPWCALGSVKSQIGHTKAAAGVAGLIKAVLCLWHKVIPPAVKVENPLEPLLDPDSPFYLSNQARPWLSRASHSRRAAISAFGFGGSNFCCLAEEGQSQKTEAQSQVGILALSGPSPSALKEALSQVGSLSGDPFAQEDLCQKSLSLFNPAERARLALCFRKNQMGQAISEAISLDLDFSLESQISTPGLRLFSEGLSATPPAPLCLKLDRSVPERQNFWEADLLGALSLSFPEAQNRLDQLSRAWEEEGRPSLGGLLWIPKEAMARLGEKRSQLLSQGTFQNCLYIALSLAFRDLLGSFGLGFQKAYARGLAGLLAALALKGAISPERAYAFLKEIPQGPDIPERALSDLGDSLELAFPEGPGHEENLEIYGSGKLIASPEEAKTELKASLLRERLSSPDRASGQSGQEEEAARSLADGQEIIGPECLLEKSFYPSSSPSEDTLSDGTFGLASLLCRIAASGRPLRLSPWPAQKSCPILEARPSGHFVPLTGANTYKPQEMPPPRLPKPAGKESSEETGNAREAGVAGDGLALLADLQKQGLKLLESIDRKLGPGPGESHFPAHLPQAHFSGRPSSLSASSASKAASGPASGQSSGFYNIPLGTREDEGRRVYPASLGASGHISLPSGQAPSPSAARAALASADSQSLAFSPQVAFRGGLAAEGQALSSALPSPSSGNGRFKGRPGNGQGLYRETGQAVDEGKAYAKATWETLCQVVARETGYPPESLSPSLDLERDLGLDSIKKVELLSELANVFPALSTDMGQDGKGSLADLAARCQGGHIIPEGKGFGPAKDQRDSYSPLPGASKRPHAPSGSAADVSLSDREAYIMAPDQADALFSILARETGYPQSALRPEMELESDLGLDSIKKVEILAALSEGLSVADPLSLSSAVTIADLLSSLGAEASRPGKAALAPEGGPLPGQAAKGPALSPLSAIPPRQPNRAASLEAGPGQDALYLSLLEVVARETGYPPQALSPDMSLEGDLGLDSIKKVEILASLAESAPGAFRSEEQSSLNQAQTLGEWLRFFAPSPQAPDRLPDKLTDRAQSQAPVLAAISGQMSPSSPSLGQSLLDRLTVKKEDERAPARPKSPKPLGPDLPDSADGAGPQKPKAFSGQDLPDGPDDHREPSLWQVAPQAIKLSPEPQAAFPEGGLIRLVGQGALAKSLERELLAKGLEAKRYSWHYDFSSFNQEGKAAKTLIFIWPGPDRDASLVIKALSALKNAGPDLSCLVGLTFLGGYFAYPKAPGHLSSPGNSISASLIGLIKCAAKEWPEVRARVLDLPLAVYETPLPSFVSAILEAAPAPGPLEMGIPSSQETSALKLRPYRPRADFSPISPGDTLVVTGGGRGVTAAVLRELCRKYRPHLVLLGRTPLGPPEPDWLRALSTDQEIMEALFKISGGNPRDLSARAKLIMAAREIRDNLSAFEAAGAKADYISGDYSDAAYLDQVARKVRSRFGPVKGFIHGAGIISDRPIKAKDPDDFAKVYATKTQMAFMLLEAFQNQPLKLIAFFSSSTARFGREGQSDYAAGNEVLNKTASELSSLYPQARVLSCAWGPWAGGMVTKSLSAQFRSEGIGLIDLEAGAQTFLRLIESPPGSPAEILVLGPDTDLSLLPGLAESPGEDDFPLSCDLSGPDSAVQGKSSSGEALGPPSGSQALRGSFR